MGILEDIQSQLALIGQKQDMLMAAVKAIAPGEVSFERTSEGAPKVSVEAEAETNVDLPTDEFIDFELGLDKDGQYWDSRIHAKTKTKTAKGIWKLLRGVDKDLVVEVRAANALISADEQAEENSAPAPTGAPKPSGGKPSPSPKPSAGKKAPPPPAKKDDKKQKAIAAVNRLTDEFDVNYDAVLELLGTFGASSFDDLDPGKYKDAARDLEAWVQWLEMCNTEAKRVVDFGGEDGREGLTELYTNHGIAGIHELKFENCNAVHDSLVEYANAWQAYAEDDQ